MHRDNAPGVKPVLAERKSASSVKLDLDQPLRGYPIYHNLLMAVFSDCRSLYPSRALYDQDYKLVKQATLRQLYNAWKAVNASLAEGNFANTQWLRWRPSTPRGVRAIRQLVGLFSRLEGVCDEHEALNSWATRVATSRARICDPDVVARARRILSSLLGPAPDLWDLTPNHGPGSVATGEKSWDKWRFSVTYQQLEYLLGGSPERPTPLSADLLHLNAAQWTADRKVCSVAKHGITKVVAVPKDLLKPRIISEEPLTLQFLQQGLMRWLYRRVERRTDAIHFSDQSVNGQMCKEWEHWASLDLSDASDLVSRTIVRQLFPDDWLRLLFALRSHFAKLPDGTIVPLRTFAPMGSAICFPIEALVFYSSIRAFLEKTGGVSDVYVYGDDILVPVAYADEVVEFLKSIGMKPNHSKCCYKGSFRESCGAEWFYGEDVTVCRPKSLNPFSTSLPRASEGRLPPMVGHANRLYAAGFHNAAQQVANLVLYPVSPGSGPDSACPLLRWKRVGKTRWNPDLQRLEQQVLVLVPGRVEQAPQTYDGLQAYLTSGWSSSRRISTGASLRYRFVPIIP